MGVSRRTFLTATAAAVLAGPARAGWPSDLPEGLIFFVGNSFTRQHDIPGLVCRIADHAGVAARCHRQTANGAMLMDSVGVPGRLAQDFGGRVPVPVVLQDHSIVPLTAEHRAQSASAMSEYVRFFEKAVLFETWPRRAGHPLYARERMPAGPQEMVELTHDHYARQARRLGAAHAPVGLAWIAAASAGIDLYARDGYHANIAGAWLAAMLLARALGLSASFAAPPPTAVAAPLAATLARIAEATAI